MGLDKEWPEKAINAIKLDVRQGLFKGKKRTANAVYPRVSVFGDLIRSVNSEGKGQFPLKSSWAIRQKRPRVKTSVKEGAVLRGSNDVDKKTQQTKIRKCPKKIIEPEFKSKGDYGWGDESKREESTRVPIEGESTTKSQPMKGEVSPKNCFFNPSSHNHAPMHTELPRINYSFSEFMRALDNSRAPLFDSYTDLCQHLYPHISSPNCRVKSAEPNAAPIRNHPSTFTDSSPEPTQDQENSSIPKMQNLINVPIAFAEFLPHLPNPLFQPQIEFNEHEVWRSSRPYATRTLTGHFSGPLPLVDDWNALFQDVFEAPCNVLNLVTDLFLIQTESSLDHQKILLGSPWVFDGHFFIIDKWHLNINSEIYDIKRVPTWATLWRVPFEIRSNHSLLLQAAETLVDVICFEEGTFEQRDVEWARVAIMKDLSKRLPLSIRIKIGNFIHHIPVEFDNNQLVCIQCGAVGHPHEDCALDPGSGKNWSRFVPVVLNNQGINHDSDDEDNEGNDHNGDEDEDPEEEENIMEGEENQQHQEPAHHQNDLPNGHGPINLVQEEMEEVDNLGEDEVFYDTLPLDMSDPLVSKETQVTLSSHSSTSPNTYTTANDELESRVDPTEVEDVLPDLIWSMPIPPFPFENSAVEEEDVMVPMELDFERVLKNIESQLILEQAESSEANTIPPMHNSFVFKSYVPKAIFSDAAATATEEEELRPNLPSPDNPSPLPAKNKRKAWELWEESEVCEDNLTTTVEKLTAGGKLSLNQLENKGNKCMETGALGNSGNNEGPLHNPLSISTPSACHIPQTNLSEEMKEMPSPSQAMCKFAEAEAAVSKALNSLEGQRGSLNSIKEVLELTENQLVSISSCLATGLQSPDWKEVNETLNKARAVIYISDAEAAPFLTVQNPAPTKTTKARVRKAARSDFDFSYKKRNAEEEESYEGKGKKIKIVAKKQKEGEKEKQRSLFGKDLSLAPPYGSESAA